MVVSVPLPHDLGHRVVEVLVIGVFEGLGHQAMEIREIEHQVPVEGFFELNWIICHLGFIVFNNMG